MKRNLLLFILSFVFTISGFSQEAEKELVKEAFNLYKNAILNDKGEEAVNYVDSRTLDYYDLVLNKVKNADSAEVRSMPILDKLMVFSVRHRTSKSDILAFDGRKMLIYAIKSGMVGKSSVVNQSIGDVRVAGDKAEGTILINNAALPFHFDFYKQGGKWKIDLTSIFGPTSAAFEKMVTDGGGDENDFLFSILNILTGKKPGNEIWHPVR